MPKFKWDENRKIAVNIDDKKPIVKKETNERDEIAAKLDLLGVKYHHFNGVERLKELLAAHE